ncbi:MAG TPA: DinB family protein [Blastocatellia bacterium]|nr:DinB family protein [Blastocatellia bacterium]
MQLRDLERLYDYNRWANDQLMPILERLTPEEFTREVGGAYGSIRNTLVHMMSAQWGWLGGCGGLKRGPRLNPDDFPTLGSIKETWDRIEQADREFLASLTDDDLERMVVYPNERGEARSLPLGELMEHAANHNVHHRGQVSMMLRMMGHAPADVDLLMYWGYKHGVAVW